MAATVVITGATSGIGRAAAAELLRRGCRIVILARDLVRAERTRSELVHRDGREAPGATAGTIDIIECDLGSLASVRCAAEAVLRTCSRIDVLINNAGTYSVSRRETIDGLELALGVNHVGHFLLTLLLLDRLEESAPARVVVVSSSAHRAGRIRFDDINLREAYRPLRAYRQSKLANLLFTRELARRLGRAGVTVNAVDPGLVATAFGSRAGEKARGLRVVMQVALRPLYRSPRRGAETVVFLAVDPVVGGVTGRYFRDRKEVAPAARATDDEDARRLWEVTVRLAGPASP